MHMLVGQDNESQKIINNQSHILFNYEVENTIFRTRDPLPQHNFGRHEKPALETVGHMYHRDGHFVRWHEKSLGCVNIEFAAVNP